jgi:flagellar biosynthesis/type III secretory pathway M-ring protein FliF/YscJ
MKKIAAVIICLLLLFLLVNPVIAKRRYKTYEVVEVTEKTLVLQRTDGREVEIDRSRRPYLEIGDKVRYDKHRNRLGRTLDEK